MLPRVRVISYTEDGDRLVAISSKRSLSSKDIEEIDSKMNDEEVDIWIRETLKRGHLSPWEHSVYTFEIVCSRVCSHQLVRHRIASYTQLSQRYNDKLLQPEDPGYWRDLAERLLNRSDKDLEKISEIFFIDPDWDLDTKYFTAYQYAKAVESYWDLRRKGLEREDARYILPQAIATKIVVTMNAREILHFLGLRMCTHAQKEIRLVAWMLRDELIKIHPRLFRYAGPYCLLDNNLHTKNVQTLEEFISEESIISIDRCREMIPREGIRNCVKYSLNEHIRFREISRNR